jgi:hypothetical protein
MPNHDSLLAELSDQIRAHLFNAAHSASPSSHAEHLRRARNCWDVIEDHTMGGGADRVAHRLAGLTKLMAFAAGWSACLSWARMSMDQEAEAKAVAAAFRLANPTEAATVEGHHGKLEVLILMSLP